MTKKAKQYRSCTKQISTGTQVSQVPSSNHIIESDDEDIIQHLEEKASNAILINNFGEECSDLDCDIYPFNPRSAS